MSDQLAHGRHVYLDYTGFHPQIGDVATWMLDLLLDAAKESGVKVVHSHVEPFDGIESPAGFAAVVLIDESHITAHSYEEKGWLAIDAFTCGEHDPNEIADRLHMSLQYSCPSLELKGRRFVARFLN